MIVPGVAVRFGGQRTFGPARRANRPTADRFAGRGSCPDSNVICSARYSARGRGIMVRSSQPSSDSVLAKRAVSRAWRQSCS